MRNLTRMRLVSASWVFFLVVAGGCVTASQAPAAPFSITMRSPDQFVVDGHATDLAHLVKVLGKNDVPKNEPLIIEMPAHIPFDTVKRLTQVLASAGYKPFFKNPRHAAASVGNRPAGTGPGGAPLRRP